jgi:hypothetical protein
MKAFVYRSIAIAALVYIIMATSVSNAAYLVAVKAGDSIRYDINVTYQGQSATGTIKLTVQSVQGNLITGTYEVTVQGQTAGQPEQFTLDVSTGSGGSASGFIIPANLTVGNFIPGEAASVETIGDWRGRKAIVANASSPYMGFMSRIYWDQATGILLESTGSLTETQFSITLAETTLWSDGLFGLDKIFIIVVVSVVIIAVVAGFMLRKKRAQAFPTMAQGVPPPPPPPPPP